MKRKGSILLVNFCLKVTSIFLFYFQNASYCQSRLMFCPWALLNCLSLLQPYYSKLQKGQQQESMVIVHLKSSNQIVRIIRFSIFSPVLSFHRCPVKRLKRLLGNHPNIFFLIYSYGIENVL